MIEPYDLEAGFIAAQRADALYELGDIDGFHAWARIANAIKSLRDVGKDGKDMRHLIGRPDSARVSVCDVHM